MLINKIYKFAMGVEYNGYHYHGWQKQKHNINTIQQHIEFAISRIANHTVEIFCAGRTDVGVHSTGQVIHFETYTFRKIQSWILGINSLLPYDIVIQWIIPVHHTFHARFSAIARKYYYVIYNYPYRNSILNYLVTHYKHHLNIDNMNKAAQFLVGEHDFTSFTSKNCQSNSFIRNIIYCRILKKQSFIFIQIKANSFLYHMVRNIVGSLLEIGKNNKPITWLLDLLHAKDRTKAGITAKPYGLYLVKVTYPKNLNIPDNIYNNIFTL
ncbi:tRNA pseudouridine(38-40) synthase TruA [Enterobacteriaceae endosymbiont of Neohaemonia nigricornis]|uniref:tRNA pseudouridine(38-40) synthase TruA n=1 Tax=Enterobacteriaceae endosymbiont of Neohaemonia nigricornis TaxID=2675792 RepID=UPI001449175F|nr:tRNA pseudouridine(38-40) synthase TruA [Enterobacteriaceae endosymbiont of Neohaemonia nigricornis]QJC30268.1 tRNA pseudouridine(38-40) synthase TruA [Enterobacteriaceae endosymbiont of Neohaemonia nigricornis]